MKVDKNEVLNEIDKLDDLFTQYISDNNSQLGWSTEYIYLMNKLRNLVKNDK